MRAYERLLKYVSIYTTSDPDSATVPSSMRQYDLARILVDELNALGLENVHVDENGIVYGWLSATPGCEAGPALGFIAHMDTSPTVRSASHSRRMRKSARAWITSTSPSSAQIAPTRWTAVKKAKSPTRRSTPARRMWFSRD